MISRRDFLEVVGLGTVGLAFGRSLAGCVALPGWQPVGNPIVVRNARTAFEATYWAQRDWQYVVSAHSNGSGAGPFFVWTPDFGYAQMRVFVNEVLVGQDTLRTGVARGSVIRWEALPGDFVLPAAISDRDFDRLAPGQRDALAYATRHGAV